MTDRRLDAQLPPSATDVEVAVLGAIMLNNGCLPEVVGILEPTDFYHPAHRLIYSAIYRIAERSEPIDMATVATELEKSGDLAKVGGPNALIDIADSVYTAANATAHARIIKDKAVLRQLAWYAGELSEVIHNHPGSAADLVAEAQGKLESIGRSALPGRKRRTGVTTAMDTVDAEEIDWMWKPWLPLGKITIVEGNPKTGKSFLTLQLAAIVTRGWAFPGQDGRPGNSYGPANVIIMNAEDNLADTLRPRLDAAEADCSRVFAFTGVRSMQGTRSADRLPSFQDIAEIEDVIVQHSAKLLVVDPIQAYLGRNVDMNQAAETRPVLTEIALIAARQRCAVLIVRHLRKSGGDSITQGLGGIDIFGIGRSIWLIMKDPQDPARRLLVHSASNNAREAGTQSFTLGDGFRWTGSDNRTIEELMQAAAYTRSASPSQSIDHVVDWLRDTLVTPLSSTEIQARARRSGFSKNNLWLAKSMLQIEAYKSGPLTFWRMPNTPQ